MRSEYSKALRAVVEREMRASSFGWQPEQLKSPYVFSGERLFKRGGDTGLLLWCVLVPDQKFERFTFDIGWSKLGRFPQLAMRPSLQAPANALHLQEYFVRLGTLSSGADRWWEIEPFLPPQDVNALVKSMQRIPAPEARARVEPVAKKALAALESFGVPFLESIAS